MIYFFFFFFFFFIIYKLFFSWVEIKDSRRPVDVSFLGVVLLSYFIFVVNLLASPFFNYYLRSQQKLNILIGQFQTNVINLLDILKRCFFSQLYYISFVPQIKCLIQHYDLKW